MSLSKIAKRLGMFSLLVFLATSCGWYNITSSPTDFDESGKIRIQAIREMEPTYIRQYKDEYIAKFEPAGFKWVTLYFRILNDSKEEIRADISNIYLAGSQTKENFKPQFYAAQSSKFDFEADLNIIEVKKKSKKIVGIAYLVPIDTEIRYYVVNGTRYEMRFKDGL